ncbi:hypothetical protein GGI04_005778, partial [Coemansia thaxteri]
HANAGDVGLDAVDSSDNRVPADRLASTADSSKQFADPQHLSDQFAVASADQSLQTQGADAHHLRRNIAQSPSFAGSVLPDSVQFQNYS